MEHILKTLGTTFLSLKEFGFAYGMQGIMMRRNLENLWFADNVTSSPHNIYYLSSNTIMSNMKDIVDSGLDNIPFGIAEIDDVKNNWNQSFLPPKSKTIKHRIAKISTIYESDDQNTSMRYMFYKKQRERKSWWRRISQNPGIYWMSETKSQKGAEYSEIQARFPFGNIVVETIHFNKSPKKLLPSVDSNSDLRLVENVTYLDWGCLALLCDGYIERDGSNELQVYPNILGYKTYCRAIIDSEDDENTREELNDLTLYVIELMKAKGVECLIINDVKRREIIRVPYIITVNKDSLIGGIVEVVCQRTLCGEQVHITKLADRMYDLCIGGI